MVPIGGCVSYSNPMSSTTACATRTRFNDANEIKQATESYLETGEHATRIQESLKTRIVVSFKIVSGHCNKKFHSTVDGDHSRHYCKMQTLFLFDHRNLFSISTARELPLSDISKIFNNPVQELLLEQVQLSCDKSAVALAERRWLAEH